MKVYRLRRDSLVIGAAYDIRELDVNKTPGGYRSLNNRKIPALDDPNVRISIIVYSKTKDVERIDNLCDKIRKAVEEYNGRC